MGSLRTVLVRRAGPAGLQIRRHASGAYQVTRGTPRPDDRPVATFWDLDRVLAYVDAVDREASAGAPTFVALARAHLEQRATEIATALKVLDDRESGGER